MNISNINTNLINNTVSNASYNNFESKLTLAYDENDKEKLKGVCDDFESIMLNMVFKEMKATVPESTLIESSSAKKIFESMYEEKLMETATKGSKIGLSKIMYNQMLKNIDNLYNIK